MNLPPFPELPDSPQERLRWIAWGELCQRTPPEGYALVPIEPTEEMMERGSNCAEYAHDDVYPSAAGDIYRAMVAVAIKKDAP